MAVAYKDYYKLLGVGRNAKSQDIAKAYKKLARQYHPDLNPGNKQAEEKFKEINEAYEVLKDDEKRRLYDQLGPNWQHGQQFHGEPGFENVHFTFNGKNFDGNGFSDFFETLFGGGAGRGFSSQGASAGRPNFGPDPFGGFSSRPRRGRDIEAQLDLTLEVVASGGHRQVTVQTVQGPKTLDVNVPAGIKEGAKLRLAGQGEGILGGSAGDLFLKVRYVPHPSYTVEDDNLLTDVALSPWEATLGCQVEVPTLGGTVSLNIPAGSSSGRKFRLRGKGLGKGDLLVRVMVKVPAELSTRERDLWQELAAASSFKARG